MRITSDIELTPLSLDYTEELFATAHDEANRTAVKAVKSENLNLVGLAVYGKKTPLDKVLKGLSLHP